MAKKPNTANITHGLSELGGGSIKNGGGGMLQGIENVFKVGVEYGAQLVLGVQQQSANIGVADVLLLGNENDDK